MKNLSYVVEPAIAGGLVYLFDVFYENKGYTSGFVMNDFLAMFGSSLSSKIANDVINSIVNIPNELYINMLIKPIINVLLYPYLYNLMVVKQFPITGGRDTNITMILAALVSLISSYTNDPMTNLILGYNSI